MQMLKHTQGARYIRRICQGAKDRRGESRELKVTGMNCYGQEFVQINHILREWMSESRQ